LSITLSDIMSLLKKPSVSGKAKRKLADISTEDSVESNSSSSASSSSASSVSDSDSDPDSGSETEDSPVKELAETVTDEPALSHAEKRRQKKRKLNSGDAVPVDATRSSAKKEKKGKKSGEVSEGGNALLRRQNSVWIGNLSYKTTAVMLKAFFEGLEITRIHMPLKAPPGGIGPKVNSGCVFFFFVTTLLVEVELISHSFAYVDFATPDAKLAAIALSERNLEGRRLLIKDGSCPPTVHSFCG